LNRSRIFLAAGIALAIVAFVAVLAFGSPAQQNSPPQVSNVSVVVAAQDIALGTAVSADLITTQERPAADAVDGFTSADSVLGSVTRQPVTRGQMLRASDFQSGTGGTSIVAALRPGLRAIAVPLDEVTAVAYLVQPGDYVDVLIAVEDLDGLNPVVKAVASPLPGSTAAPDPYVLLDQYLNNTSVKVLVQNVQVLATQVADPTEANGGRPSVAQAFLAVLAVSPQDAELIRFAQLDGHVSLVLRSPGDVSAGTVTTNGVTLYELVTKWGVLPPKPVVAAP
jgi:pilus assembly protein CpaB